ncbi:Importin subunit alpha-8 [Fukomys damarensis]|uniref:Importin subunit alpha-8 n=1 Tax=Fukomys damarensis TaxID=885580 RepID=A0A091DUQ1_FUKDA|nr:Importin subunit alpha-8 [Fukomys damarensis]
MSKLPSWRGSVGYMKGPADCQKENRAIGEHEAPRWTSAITFLQNITWNSSNLCRSKDPYPCEAAVRQVLPVLSHLLQHQDTEILSDTRWALSYLRDACSERIAPVLDTGVLPRLVELLTSVELGVLTPSLHTVGNIVTGTDHQTQMATDAGMLRNGEYKVQKEAVWTVANPATGASADQTFRLVHCGVLGPLLNLLTVPDVKIILIILDAISYVLQAAEKLSDKKSLCLLMEELGGIDNNGGFTTP